MYYEIYLDVVFLMNLVLDYTILRITESIIKRKSTFLRCFLAALFGSVLLCILCLCDMEILIRHSFLTSLVINTSTLLIVFCRKNDNLCFVVELIVKFYLISFILAGVIEAVYIGTGISWWCVCLVVLMLRIIIKPLMMIMRNIKSNENMYYDVTLFLGDKSVATRGLLDTGNHLKEPISGKPVHVLELSAVMGVLPEMFLKAVKDYYENAVMGNGLYLEKGIRMVPFRSVGAPAEKLLVTVMADEMIVKQTGSEVREEKPYIALFDGKLANDSSYCMLLHVTKMIDGRK